MSVSNKPPLSRLRMLNTGCFFLQPQASTAPISSTRNPRERGDTERGEVVVMVVVVEVEVVAEAVVVEEKPGAFPTRAQVAKRPRRLAPLALALALGPSPPLPPLPPLPVPPFVELLE